MCKPTDPTNLPEDDIKETEPAKETKDWLRADAPPELEKVRGDFLAALFAPRNSRK